jgi:hypothetical protein
MLPLIDTNLAVSPIKMAKSLGLKTLDDDTHEDPD